MTGYETKGTYKGGNERVLRNREHTKGMGGWEKREKSARLPMWEREEKEEGGGLEVVGLRGGNPK